MLNNVFLMRLIHSCWQWINAVDTYLFLKVNTNFTNSFLDAILPWWRDANTWTPVYLFLIVFAVMNFQKKSFFWILGVIVTLILTDQFSSSFVKLFFERPRPCNDPILMSQVRLLLPNCGGGYSFTSSHATNHFGFATFVFFTLRNIFKKWGSLFFLWAATISYAQIYVGVHYPLDVLCGTIFGILIGYGSSQFFMYWKGPVLIETDNQLA